MLDIEIAMTIRRTRRDVAAVMFNPRYDPIWIRSVRQARPLTPGPLRQGSRLERETSLLGRPVSGIVDVVEFVTDRSMKLAGVPPLGLQVHYTLEGIPEGTITRIHAQGTVKGMLRMAEPAFAARLRGAIMRDLEQLKALVESGGGRNLKPMPWNDAAELPI